VTGAPAPARVVVVLGGDTRQRAAATAALLSVSHPAGGGGRALLLTPAPAAVDPALDTGEDGAVEVRHDDPSGRVASFLAGDEVPCGPDGPDEWLAALATGGDSPLAATLCLEYARRAAGAGWWDTVVVELDGEAAALRRLAAPTELAALVERRWPAHRRYASMAAGERAEPRVRAAHLVAGLAADVAGFLRGVGVHAVGPDAAALGELASLVVGRSTGTVEGDPGSGYSFALSLPSAPVGPVRVADERLRVPLEPLELALALPALLLRCVPGDATFGGVDPGRLVVRFDPDPELWPPSLVPDRAAPASG